MKVELSKEEILLIESALSTHKYKVEWATQKSLDNLKESGCQITDAMRLGYYNLQRIEDKEVELINKLLLELPGRIS